MSLPSRERGLKFPLQEFYQKFSNVAPFAGAWIEITFSNSLVFAFALSLPSRERGLKFSTSLSYVLFIESLPSRERGLKL